MDRPDGFVADLP